MARKTIASEKTDPTQSASSATHSSTNASTTPTILENLPFWFVSALLVLLPVFVIPSSLVSVLFSKMLLLTSVVLISLAILIFNAIRSGKILLPSWRTLAVVGIVPIAAIVSAFLSADPSSSFIGIGSEFDTVHFISLGFLLTCLVAAFFQSKQRIFSAYLGILGIFAIVSIFHIIRFITGPEFLNIGGAFNTVVVNTLGAWNDLSIYSGLAVILSFITIELVDMGKKFRAVFYAVLVLGLALLGVTNFYLFNGPAGLAVPLTMIIGCMALFVFVYILSQNYRSSKKMPVASLIVLVFCVVMTVAASPIATQLYQKIGISESDVADVHPAMGGTYVVAENIISKSGAIRAIFGVGPNKFFVAWGLFKPAEVNKTVFWNSDFNYGAGYVSTSIVTLGILGFLAWMFFIISTLWIGTRSVFTGVGDRFSVYIFVSTLLATLYLWIVSAFAVPSTTTLVFAFFFTGLLGASLVREGVISTYEFGWTTSQRKGFVAVLLLVIVFIGLVVWGFVWTRHFIASIQIEKARSVLQSAENIPQSQALIVSAIQHAPGVDLYLRLYAQLKLIELQSMLSSSEVNGLNEQSRAVLAQAVEAAETAALRNPGDYHNHIFLGQVYQSAGILGIEGAGDAAIDSYRRAYVYIPSSPLPAYLAGYLYALAKDPSSARAALEQALQLKPDFQEAYTLYAELQKANPSAQAAASKDIQTSSSPAKIAPSGATSTNNKR